MGKFREFLITEESVGLGNLGAKITQLFHSQDFNNQIGGAFASTDVTGTEGSNTHGSAGHPLHLPSTDLTIPQMTKSGRITMLALKKNPIFIKLSDGTEANFTYDEYKKIQGTPEVGKVMTITFQRHPEDSSRMYSKIDQAVVTD
jgi:hypothetical protein